MQFPIHFSKMSGTGNDFIIIDHRQPIITAKERSTFARAVCRRSFSVGADGLILIENSDNADFKWDFYNADGSAAEMCGNGARCAARFAFERGIAPDSMTFETVAGIIEAQIVGSNVKIRLTAPADIALGQRVEIDGFEKEIHSLNTGVPHVVHFVDESLSTPVLEWGRFIRHHELFQPAGTNANFVTLHEHEIHVRTYERGVENETLACGTGAVAAAIVAALHGHVSPPVNVRTSGGERLVIHFRLEDASPVLESSTAALDQRISDVYLEGPAHFIYEGELNEEALV